MTEDNVLTANVLESDHLYFDTMHDKCSRCRELLRKEDVPLILWKEDKRYVYVYCPSCTDDVVGGK